MDDVLSAEIEGDVARKERREHGQEQDASPRSNSPHSTLSGLPTRWISSLSSSLSRSATAPISHQAKSEDGRRRTGATPSLESIFAASSSAPAVTSRGRPATSKSGKRTATSLTPSTSLLDLFDRERGGGGGVATPVPGAHDHDHQPHRDGGVINNNIIHHRDPGGRGAANNSAPPAAGKGHVHVQTPIQIPLPHRSERPSTSHGYSPTPASITHETPFGSHVFVPISGAPGFMDKRYDWDKGYSNGLMREMTGDGGSVERGEQLKGWESDVDLREGRNVKVKGRRESVVKRIKGKIEEKMGAKKAAADKENEGASVKVVGEGRLGLGEFMEKKSGSIELISRKDATLPVLDVPLADTVSVPSLALSELGYADCY